MIALSGDWYKWAEQVSKRRTRKQAKRARRREKICRKIMVHYAGNAPLAGASRMERLAETAPARGWSTRRAVRVPRRLRDVLGQTVGGPLTWARAYKLTANIGAVLAAWDNANRVNSDAEATP